MAGARPKNPSPKKEHPLLQEVRRQEKLLEEMKKQLEESSRTAIEQIEARKNEVIRQVRLSSKRLRNQVRQAQNKQVNGLDNAANRSVSLRQEIAEAISEENLNRKDLTVEEMDRMRSDWSRQYEELIAELEKPDYMMQLVLGDTNVSLGRIALRTPEENSSDEKSPEKSAVDEEESRDERASDENTPEKQISGEQNTPEKQISEAEQTLSKDVKERPTEEKSLEQDTPEN